MNIDTENLTFFNKNNSIGFHIKEFQKEGEV